MDIQFHIKHLKHFKTLRNVSILSDHHQGALFLAKVMLQYSQFNSYLRTRCCGSISCCVGMCCGAVARCASKHTEQSDSVSLFVILSFELFLLFCFMLFFIDDISVCLLPLPSIRLTFFHFRGRRFNYVSMSLHSWSFYSFCSLFTKFNRFFVYVCLSVYSGHI